jgi:hypothetical protein
MLKRVSPREGFGSLAFEPAGGEANVVEVHLLALDLGAAIGGAG